jgi:flagellar hook-length control protein FliK
LLSAIPSVSHFAADSTTRKVTPENALWGKRPVAALAIACAKSALSSAAEECEITELPVKRTLGEKIAIEENSSDGANVAVAESVDDCTNDEERTIPDDAEKCAAALASNSADASTAAADSTAASDDRSRCVSPNSCDPETAREAMPSALSEKANDGWRSDRESIVGDRHSDRACGSDADGWSDRALASLTETAEAPTADATIAAEERN